MKHFLALAVGLAALWLLLSGIYDNNLLLALGVLSVLLSLWAAARLGVIDEEGVPVQLFPRILFYWIWLFVQIGKANFAVARAALAADLNISPRMIRVKAPQRTDVGKATFANSITLTPGTVTIDLYDGEVLVHALTEELADPSGFEDMSQRVCAVEGKERAS